MVSKYKQRIFISLFFFLFGFCFSTWASRIPTIKNIFSLNDAALGTILLCMPFSSLIGLPISGWLISAYDSRIPLSAAFGLLAMALGCIGFAQTTSHLVASICLFSFSSRILNISLNTQALNLQKLFEQKINGSFHALWSVGGIAGICVTTVCISLKVPMYLHLVLVAFMTVVVVSCSYQFLLGKDRSPKGNSISVGKPDPFILYLGVLAFFASICEGGMFDWSGIYFREVVKEEIFTLGYLIFMVCMALSRFISDRLIERAGMPAAFTISGLLIVTGILTAVIFPSFWPAMIGFCLVGFGTASVIPMTYSLAGSSKKYSSGMALSILSTYGIVGMFIGPPLIGYLSQLYHLRISFMAFAIAGVMLIPVSRMFFNYKKRLEQ
jgi:MFS family permease